MDYDRMLRFLPKYLQKNDYFKSLLEELTFQVKETIMMSKMKNIYLFCVPINAEKFFPFILSVTEDGKVSLSNSWLDIHKASDGTNKSVKRFSSVYCEPNNDDGFSISNRNVSIEMMQIDKIKKNSGSPNGVEVVSEAKYVKFQMFTIRDYDKDGVLKSISEKIYKPEFVTTKKSSSWEEIAPTHEMSYRQYLSTNDSVMYVINFDTDNESFYYITGENGYIETKETINKSQYLEYLSKGKDTSKEVVKTLILNKK